MIILLPLLLVLAAQPPQPGANLPRNPIQRFNQLDTNNDGAITPDEAPNWFKMKGLDANNDQRITLKEGMDWLSKQQANQQRPQAPGGRPRRRGGVCGWVGAGEIFEIALGGNGAQQFVKS